MKQTTKLFMGMIGLISMFMIGQANAVIIDQLGDQDFVDGQTPILASDVISTNAGDPTPFNIASGSDPAGTLGSITYTHIFSLSGESPLSALITIGLIDHDSFNIFQDTIDIFFDGVQQDDTTWLGISTAPSSNSIVSMIVDAAILLDGSLTVEIFATQAAEGFAGNSITADFSRLEITTAAVPEPTTLALLSLGLLGFGISGRRQSKS